MSTDTTPTETTDADALADELLAIHDATEDGNKVRAEVRAIESTTIVSSTQSPNAPCDAIGLTVRLPHGGAETFALDKPVPWDPERFTLAAILEDQGLGPGNVHRLVGEDVLVERDGDEWALVDPMAPPKSFDTTTAATGVAVGASVFGAIMGNLASGGLDLLVAIVITGVAAFGVAGFIMAVFEGEL